MMEVINSFGMYPSPPISSLAAVKIKAGAITSATISAGSLGTYTIPGWIPYLSQTEYEALKAWRDGDNMLIHKLSQA